MTKTTTIKRGPSVLTKVVDALRLELRELGQPGAKLNSISSYARRFGVSYNTVLSALTLLQQEGLVELRHGSGTYVADGPKSKAVAVVTETEPGLVANSFQMRLFLLLNELVARHGYRCCSYIAPAGSKEGWRGLAEDVAHGRLAGAVFVSMNADTLGIPFAKHHVPCAGLGYPYQSSPELDYVDYMRQGVRHLLERGCRRIALMQWMANTPGVQVAQDTFRSTLADYGAPVRNEWIRQMVSPSTPGAGWEEFREIWSARDEKPDGLLVTDDMLFRDVAMAILDSHIQVPQQLQVVVHANKGSGLTYPFPVSRLEVDLDEWAEALIQQLITLMNQEPVGPPVPCFRARLIPAEAKDAEHVAGSVASAAVNSETSK